MKDDIKHLHEKVLFSHYAKVSYLTNLFCPVQDPIPFLRSIPHVADAGSTSYCWSYHLGSTNRTTTSDIHETSGRRVRKRMGALRRRPKTPIRKQRLPQETRYPPRIPSLASRHQQTKYGCQWTSFRDCPITWGRFPASC